MVICWASKKFVVLNYERGAFLLEAETCAMIRICAYFPLPSWERDCGRGGDYARNSQHIKLHY